MKARPVVARVCLVLALTGCGMGPMPSPSVPAERTCPMLTPTVIPPGFMPVERHSVNAGGEWFADITVYRDPSGASLGFGSGSPGGIAGVGTGQHVVIRGHEAEIFHESTLDQFAVIWTEATPEKPCHLYSISATGLELAEFVEVLGGVK